MDRVQVHADAFTRRATMSLAGCKKLSSFLRSFGLNAPFLGTQYMHRRMKGFQLGLDGGPVHRFLESPPPQDSNAPFERNEAETRWNRCGSLPLESDSSWSENVAPRAYWKGYLKLSLVSCPVALYPATSEREKISFHQLHKQTGNRIRYKKVDADTGREVENDDIIKGYEVSKGEYIEIEREELEAVEIESKRVIDIEQFVPKDDIDELYVNNPYYLVPDGEVGQQAFAVIREAIRKEGMVALGKVVFTSREHIIALEARGKGMMGMTLRYPYEVRSEEDYFDEVEDEKVPKDMLDLATHIVETKTGKFDPGKFEDRYEEALKALIKKKQKGEKIERPKERAPTNVVNLMEALRQSVKENRGSERRKPARTGSRGPKKTARSTARHRKAS
jgi:DNA end-binding protein Ku